MRRGKTGRGILLARVAAKLVCADKHVGKRARNKCIRREIRRAYRAGWGRSPGAELRHRKGQSKKRHIHGRAGFGGCGCR